MASDTLAKGTPTTPTRSGGACLTLADASARVIPVTEFLAMFRDDLVRVAKSKRPALFKSRLSMAQFHVKELDGFYNVSCERGGCPPPIQWRSFANTVMRLDGENLPVIIAYGIPDLFSVPAVDLNAVLEAASSRSGGDPANPDGGGGSANPDGGGGSANPDMTKGIYRVEPILFGSVCWLFRYEGEWRLATKRRIDTKDMLMRVDGPRFWDSFEQALSNERKADGETIGKMGETELNPDYTYSFVLHDARMHIFSYSDVGTRLWHVSTIDNRTGKAVKASIAGIRSPPSMFEGTPTKEQIRALCLRCTNSLHDVDQNLGFILRSDKAVPYPNVIIKSPLYTFIEGYIGKIIPLRRVIANVLYSGPTEQTKFRAIFPHLAPMLTMAYEGVDRLVDSILRYHRVCSNVDAVPSESDTIGELYKIVLGAYGRFRLNETNVRNALINGKGAAAPLVKDALFSLLPTEEARLSLRPSIALPDGERH